MSQLSLKKIKLGDNADTSKNFVISVPAVADGTLTIERENGTDVLTIDASGLATISGGVVGARRSSETKSLSGTYVDFTDVPSWTKKITVVFSGASSSSTSVMLIQLGTTSGVVATGYLSTDNTFSSSPTCTSGTTGFQQGAANSTTRNGVSTLINTTGYGWVESHTHGGSVSLGVSIGGGIVTLASLVTTVRLTMTNGTDTFDAGSATVIYEE